MLKDRPFTFACYISGPVSRGHIVAPTGQAIIIEPAEMPDLLLDLSANAEGKIGDPAYQSLVLEEWFARKTAPVHQRPALRLVG